MNSAEFQRAEFQCCPLLSSNIHLTGTQHTSSRSNTSCTTKSCCHPAECACIAGSADGAHGILCFNTQSNHSWGASSQAWSLTDVSTLKGFKGLLASAKLHTQHAASQPIREKLRLSGKTITRKQEAQFERAAWHNATGLDSVKADSTSS